MADGVAGIPGGTLTFLFTDIEGSTRKWETEPEAMSVSLSRHDGILRGAIEANGGYVFKTVGDAFCASFRDPVAAVRAVCVAQRGLAAEPWPVQGGILVRMVLHSGVVEERDGDYFGPVLNRAARLLSLASGGQVLLSLAATELLHDHLPEGFSLQPLGSFKLKDLSRPEAVTQLVAPGLREAFPALKSIDRMPNNLPLQPGAFIGREAELAAIRRAFSPAPAADEACRLLSVVGPGGSGKTRLSLQAGAELLEDFEGGVWFVDLSSCRGEEESVREACRILAVRETDSARGLQALERFIGTRRLLLIMDNLEQDLRAGKLLAALLAACPGLVILATSREALRIRWERVLPLPPLALPGREAPVDAAHLAQYDAVSLFIERARAARPGFSVTAKNAPAIAGLCSRLDGIPLAIELAAARVRAFSAEDILSRLEEDPGFLDAGNADLPARHRTLRATAQWSYSLLDKAEKECFRALGVFRSSFSLESASIVLEKGDRSRGRVASLLASMVEKSLLVHEEEGEGTRYRMLGTLRVFAWEKLDADPDRDLILDAHARRYLALAGQADEAGGRLGTSGPRRGAEGSGTRSEAGFYREVDAEYPDIRAAFERFMVRSDRVSALRLACGVHAYWRVRRLVEEGRSWLEEALEATEDPLPSGLRAAALRALGELAYLRGDYSRALELYEASQELVATIPGPGRDNAQAMGTLGRAWVLYRQGRFDEARLAFEAASRAEGQLASAFARLGLGTIGLQEGHLEEAARNLEEAYKELVARGAMESAAEAAGNLGLVELALGRRAAGLARMAEAGLLAEELGDRDSLMVAENNLGYYAFEDGRIQEAATHYGRLEVLARGTGSALHLSYALCGEAECELAQGRSEDAARLAREAGAVARREPGLCGLAMGIGTRIEAGAALASGDAEEASRLAARAMEELAGDASELDRAKAVLVAAEAAKGGKGQP